jgi:hypothetical protein
MLLSKINPAAKKSVQNTPFESTIISLDFMTVIARPYILGSETTNFSVEFGTVTEVDGVPSSFHSQYQTQVILTSDELSTWGTDDETLLNIIATKLNIDVLEFVNIKRN